MYVYEAVFSIFSVSTWRQAHDLLKSSQTCSRSHNHSHVAKYILGSVGKDSSCPAGYAQADKANCGAAARSAGIVAGAESQNSAFLEGNWDHVPAGCSINTAGLTASSGPVPHWNGRSSGKNNGNYRVVCEYTGLALWGLSVFMVYVLCILM